MSNNGLLGLRIRQLRNDWGWTQQQFSDELNRRYGVEIVQSHVANMETGGKLPSLTVLTAIVKTLDTSADYLLGLTDNPMSVRDIEEDIVQTGGMDGRLRKLLAIMPEAKKQQLLSIAELYTYGDRDTMGVILRTVGEVGGAETLSKFIDALDSLWPGFVGSMDGAPAADA
jgi:transcriptional regulator with XRE-family HTH domain